MLRVNNVSKSFAHRPVLRGISFHLNPHERVGLLGLNGSGKSTLLDVIAGRTPPDEGSVSQEPPGSLAYVTQDVADAPSLKAKDIVFDVIPGLAASRRELNETGNRLAATSESLALTSYSDAHERFESLGGYIFEERLPEAMSRVGLSHVDPELPAASLSGGQATRLGLAGVLIANPDVLLLDEPTNHLDIEGLEWTESFLDSFRGAALIVSHDRAFLDRTVTRILELDAASEGAREFHGNYAEYVALRDAEARERLAEWKRQEAEIRRVRADIARLKERASSLESSKAPSGMAKITFNPQAPARRIARLAKTRERRLERSLESEEHIEKPRGEWRMKLEFPDLGHGAQRVAALENVHASLGGQPILTDVSAELMHGERIALIGPNGSGKTTLLRLIAGELEPDAGMVRLGPGIAIGYMPQQHRALNPADTPLSILRRESDRSETETRNFLHFFLFQGDQVFTPVGSLSYGERTRLILASLVIKGASLLLLDEPTNHLDIPSRERFETALEQFRGTVVIISHDRTFIDSSATALWVLQPSGDGSSMRRYLDRPDMARLAESR